MARVVDHLSVGELEARYEACQDVTSSRHFQTIHLLAKGHSTREVADITLFGQRWIEQLVERYNAFGPGALGDRRRANRGVATVLKPELLEGLRGRLREPPPDGGIWTSGKVATWMAGEPGLERLAPQRGWEALQAIGWSIRKPRPRNPKAATPEEQDAFKKTRRGGRRGNGAPRRHADRDLRHRRASYRPEAGDAAGVGADRRAADRSWPSPLRMALCDRLRLAGDRRMLLVRRQRRIEAVLRRVAARLRRGSRRRQRPHHRSRAPTTPAGTPRQASTFPTAFVSPSCLPTPPRFSPPNACGLSSTSRSSTSTSTTSTPSTRSSAPVAPNLQITPRPSAAEPDSIGGPLSPIRSDRPETV